MNRTFAFYLLGLSLIFAAPAAKAQPELDIVDTAAGVDTFSTLVAAVQAAGLVDALKAEGPFTVFAPTNEAFGALPEGTLDSLLLPENADQLTRILLYHVVPGALTAADVTSRPFAKTLTANQQLARFSVTDGVASVQNANIIDTDIEATNGIIHVIDTVIIPEDLPDIVDTAVNAGTFSLLVTAVQAAGLEETLRGEGPFTVFAPSDEAFGNLPEGTLESLLEEGNLQTLIDILTLHVVPGKLTSPEVVESASLPTVNGQALDVSIMGETVQVGGANVTATDIEAGNGIIHVIDTVILPQSGLSNWESY